MLSLKQKQQSHLKNLLDQKTAGFEEDKMKQEQSKLEMQLSNQKNANVVEQLKRIVAEKEEKVKHLEEEILAMQQNVSSRKGLVDQQSIRLIDNCFIFLCLVISHYEIKCYRQSCFIFS